MGIGDITEGAADALRNVGAYVGDLLAPSVRLGVTGLSRSGKTVFITALVRNLLSAGRLPFFAAVAEGRIRSAVLEPQPDDGVPRFDYEGHLARLAEEPPEWPESTRQISQLRVTLGYEPRSAIMKALGVRTLHLDIVDYPGEWLLDLALIDKSYETWAREAIAHARESGREKIASEWLGFIAPLDPLAPQSEDIARAGSRLFTRYLAAARSDEHAYSCLPPGRFLMPGDLAGSPLLTFLPLELPGTGSPPAGSLWSMMVRRYEAYKSQVVKPFFRDHFSRLDRQIVLVDALSALNVGPAAVQDLRRALRDILAAFRPGANSWLSAILARRIDKIVFAATKADHLHHTSHDRLEAVLGELTREAMERASFAGAEVKVMAIAALRATREADVRQGGQVLPCIIGRPLPGERVGAQVFDGTREIAIFPGDLPADPKDALAHGQAPSQSKWEDVRFVRFRPPQLKPASATGESEKLPHIRLDRALDFLIGDRLQ